jgi:hypothetical protein
MAERTVRRPISDRSRHTVLGPCSVGPPSDCWPMATPDFPLRGGKYSEFEGGVRVAAFVSGGAIVPAARGKRGSGLGTLSDVRAAPPSQSA